MGKIEFTDYEACYLYCIPTKGGTFEEIGFSYSFINRDAAPTSDALSICFEKAMAANIVIKSGENYRLSEKWYAIAHQFDATANNEVEAMGQFEEMLTARTWP